METLNRKERKRENKKNLILSAAKELYARKGNSFTMQGVAELSEMAKGSLYLNFKDKDALMEALVVDVLSRLKSLIEEMSQGKKTAMELIMAMGLAYVRFYKEYPLEFSLIGAMDFLSPGIGWAEAPQSEMGFMVKNFKDHILKLIDRGITDGSIRSDLDIELSSFLVSQTVKTFVQKIAQVEKESDVKLLSGYDAQTLITGLFEMLKRAFVPKDKP